MMKRAALLHFPLFLAVILAFTHASHAQLIAGPGVSEASSSQPISNHIFSFSGTIPGQLNGALSVTFSIYPDQQSATALWTETQVVQVTAEKYTVMLGSTSPTGLPPEIFSADQAHWLGVQVNGSEKRYLLVSVPYAMKAVNADQLGGLPFSEYVTAQQLQAALQSAATPGTPTQPKATLTGPIGQAAVAGTPPQPATDFTDNNTSEVLLVTQQGTGFAIHAITSSQAEAILAQNNSIGGTALHAVATSATGAGIGVLAETASPNGISGVFNNQAGGKILSLRNNGVEVAGVDVNGNLNTSGQVQASSFSGGGFGLFGIPQSAINATPIIPFRSLPATQTAALRLTKSLPALSPAADSGFLAYPSRPSTRRLSIIRFRSLPATQTATLRPTKLLPQVSLVADSGFLAYLSRPLTQHLSITRFRWLPATQMAALRPTKSLPPLSSVADSGFLAYRSRPLTQRPSIIRFR